MASDDHWDDEPSRERRGPRGGDAQLGREKLQTPGILLLIFGLFSLFLGVALLVLYVGAPDTIARPYHDFLSNMTKGVPQQPGQPPPVPPYEDFKQQLMVQGGVGSLVATIGSVVITLGGMRMRSAKGRGMALAGSILAIIPCTTS